LRLVYYLSGAHATPSKVYGFSGPVCVPLSLTFYTFLNYLALPVSQEGQLLRGKKLGTDVTTAISLPPYPFLRLLARDCLSSVLYFSAICVYIYSTTIIYALLPVMLQGFENALKAPHSRRVHRRQRVCCYPAR